MSRAMFSKLKLKKRTVAQVKMMKRNKYHLNSVTSTGTISSKITPNVFPSILSITC